MTPPLLIDVSHTSHTRARTGVQRVVRSLVHALGNQALPITHDPYAATWRPLAAWEQANVHSTSAAEKRGARWPLSARLRGHFRRLIRPGSQLSALSSQLSPSLISQLSRLNSSPVPLLVPEIFSLATASALPALLAAVPGRRVAIFHDAIALKLPELTPAKTVARFPAYLRELLAFDAIAAVSDDSRDSLLEYWRWLGVHRPPPVQTLPLGIDAPPAALHPNPASVSPSPRILSVGSIEGRKNHLALLGACEALWSRGVQFELELIGLAHAQTGARALARIRALQSAGRALHYAGPVSDAELHAAYARCTFTVYPSLLEGFGLPVLESIAHRKPCICSGRGALGESARGGGAVMLDRVDAPSLAAAIDRLLQSPVELAQLAAQATARPLRTWQNYAADLVAWLSTVSRRD